MAFLSEKGPFTGTGRYTLRFANRLNGSCIVQRVCDCAINLAQRNAEERSGSRSVVAVGHYTDTFSRFEKAVCTYFLSVFLLSPFRFFAYHR